MTGLRVPLAGLAPGGRALDAETARYLTRVRRLGPGEAFVAFDPEARTEADAVVSSAAPRGQVTITLGAVRAASNVPTREVVVIQCVGKADKLAATVRDATELDATAVWPAVSARTVAERSSDAALTRLRKIAAEAARQSGRGDVPEILRPAPLGELLQRARAELRVMLHPGAEASIAGLRERLDTAASVALAIGPEGGFTDEEVAAARLVGFAPVRLGSTVLRTETAVAATLGALLVLRPRAEAQPTPSES